MNILKKVILLVFLCGLPANRADASLFPSAINGWKLAALLPACATAYYAVAWHEVHVLGGYLNHLRKKAPEAFSKIPYAEKERQIAPFAELFGAVCTVGCATATGLLYYLGSAR